MRTALSRYSPQQGGSDNGSGRWSVHAARCRGKRKMTDAMKDITFSYKAPEALCVTLVGDFTQWQRQPIPLNKREDGLWQVTVRLPPGTYAYALLVDDKW